MKTSRLCLGITAAIAIGLFTTSVKAHADTYQFFDLGSAGGYYPPYVGIVGITASGTVVLDDHIPVGAPLCATSGICNEYQIWVNGIWVNRLHVLTTPPDLVYDNGAPCTADAPFLTSSVPGICNNGHEVYNALSATTDPSYTDATFTGPDPATDMLTDGEADVSDVDLNSSGDFVYNISHHAGPAGENIEAIDLTTGQVPEPASIFLLGTGLLAALGTMRRLTL